MAALVDLNVFKPGETAGKLHRLIQEIDILMTSDNLSIVTNYQPNAGLSKYLFKSGIANGTVERDIQDLISRNTSRDLIQDVDVQVSFLHGKATKDIMLVDIVIEQDGAHEERQYVIA